MLHVGNENAKLVMLRTNIGRKVLNFRGLWLPLANSLKS